MKLLFLVPIGFLGLILQISFILNEKMEKYKKAVVLKGLASCVFVAMGVFGALLANHVLSIGALNAAGAEDTAALLIAIGLGFGLIGDVCLNLRLVMQDGKKVFLAGIAAFLIGHILYLIAIILQMPSRTALLIGIGAGIVCAAGLLVWIFKNITAQKVFKIFGIFYVGAVVVMTAVAVARVIVDYNLSALIFMIGAILFTASDVILIFNMFSEHKKAWMRPTNLILYYIGQLLIAASLFI